VRDIVTEPTPAGSRDRSQNSNLAANAVSLNKIASPRVRSASHSWEMSMLTFDSIPQARVVRKGGQQFAPPRAPRTQPEPSALRQQLRTIVAVAFGLWPLTAVMLLALGLLWIAAFSGSP
jgi:nitrate reductase NapE component